MSPKACSPILAEIRALPRGRSTIKQRRGVRSNVQVAMEQGRNGKQAPTNSTTLVLSREGKAAGVLVALSTQPSDSFELLLCAIKRYKEKIDSNG